MDPAFGWVQPEQLGEAFNFWQNLWEKEQNIIESLNSSSMTQSPNISPHAAESFILLEESGHSKGLKRKRDGSNKASTALGLSSKHRQRLIGKYEGCPWLLDGKQYSTGIIGYESMHIVHLILHLK